MYGLDLFSGIGGLSLALEPWVRTVAYCENDRYAQSVLFSRMADGELALAPIWDDVRTLYGGMLPRIDVITGGFPCQDISVAGNGKGLGGERSILFFEIARLTREIRPRFVFLENVAAVAFRGLDRITAEFSAIGYDCRWDMLRACDVGAPHQRERWWLLAHASSQGLTQPWPVEQPAAARQAQDFAPVEPSVQGQVWLPATAELCRIPDGIRPASHRIRCLGNAVVPQCAREAFKRLAGL